MVEVNLDLRRPQYAMERRPVVYRELLERLSIQPGVVSAAEVGFTPVSGSGWNQMAHPGDKPGVRELVNLNRVGPGYFKTMGTTLVAGREFDSRDTLTSEKVAVVNETFVKKVFGGGPVVGRSFRLDASAGEADPVYQIVGVVRNTKYFEVREDPVPIGFFPSAQDDDPGARVTYVLRTAGPVGEIFRGVKTAVTAVHPEINIRFRILTEQLRDSLLRERLMATLAGAFGLLAAVLATLGLYGVIAYMVARRRNEIGVRVALGADRGRIVRLVLREAVLLLVIGAVAGVGLALWAGRAASALLFGLKPTDPATFAAAIALLAGVALIASYGPARRAAKVEPMQALRED